MDDLGIALEPLGTLEMDMDTSMLRGGPMGTRVVVEFRNVVLTGPRLSLHQHGATSADWLVVGADATATLDIRMLLATEAGALVYVHGAGRTNANEFPRGGPIWFTPIFETADPALAWLNGIQAIARGRAAGPRATFRVYEAR